MRVDDNHGLSLDAIAFLLLASLIVAVFRAPAAIAATVETVNFIGQATLPTTLTFDSTPVGGLSDLVYDSRNHLYYAISDDRSQRSPARFYALTIDLSQGRLTLGGVTPTGMTALLQEDGQPFPPFSLDLESIALTQQGTLFVASEGDAQQQIAPFVREFSQTGQFIRNLPIPEKFHPHPQKERGVRNNLAFESLTLTPDQKFLFVATENALLQDGRAATPSHGSLSRILQYDLQTGQPMAEFLYLTEPVAAAGGLGKGGINGLVELLALDNRGHFLSIERSFSIGSGMVIKLFAVSLVGATEIQHLDSLAQLDRQERQRIQPVQKTLLLDFRTLKIPLDNIEGLSFGPRLPDGRRSLLAISDNNFSTLQFTQVLAFSLE